MGIHSQISNSRKRHKSEGGKKRRKLPAKASKVEKSVVLEGVELLSKEQLKKLARNPTNNIRPSGKRKRKMMKRLKHSQREKNAMEVEVVPGTSKAGSKSASKAADSDVVMEEMDEDMT